jgi:Rrf2 family protein
MRLRKSGRYALAAALEMARSGDRLVTAAEVAKSHRVPEAVLAKVIQQLVHAGIAVGARGAGGGYRLSREPSRITVLDLLAVFDPDLVAQENDSSDPIDRLMREVDERTRRTFASVTLETLSGSNASLTA